VSVSRPELLRDRGEDRAAHVTNMELFFDLVYVFAFTQLSELLYEHPSWQGAAETAVIFVALWWAWSYTAWATGWIDPERPSVVALLALLMVASLVMSTAILESFGDRGETFAIAYVSMQLLRSGFMVWAFGLRDTMGRNYAQLLAWSVLSAVIWLVGGEVHDPHTRLLIWAVAAAVDLIAPILGFRLPLAGATQISEWTIAGGHLAERFQLVLMIAFGESFLRIGESFAADHGTFPADTGFLVGFLLVFGLWTIYFLHHAAHGARTLEHADEDAARLARSAYSYAHAAMVAAVIVVAVVIHKVIEAPEQHVDASFAAICIAGPVLYMVGIALSKRWLGHGRLRWPLVGGLAIVVAGTATAFGERLVELIAVTAVAVAVAIWAQVEE
jgi:low temperature requirement protein LtrA